MTLYLSMSTNPLINRIAEPDDLVKVCAQEIGIDRLQVSNEFISPAWPAVVRKRLADKFASEGAKQGVRATSVMTGAQARLNNMTHPDAEVRAWTIDWMTKLGEIASDLGARSVGSQYGIMTWRDYEDEARREELIVAALDGWEEVWNRVSKLGLEYVYWEPMSVGRELGHTIAAAEELNDRAKARGIPLKMILDVDHGDLESENPDDTDPYKWIEALAADSPMIHVKQSHAVNKSGHNPFIEPYNSQGRIHGEELSTALKKFGREGMEICLELSFREREPADNRVNVIDALRRSADYWRPFVD